MEDIYECPECGNKVVIEDWECTHNCEESEFECECPLHFCSNCGARF